MKNKGFTLIELLVVIAIISLLSSVVMASLNQSRVRAQEAAIVSTLQSIKTQAELEYSKTGDYSGVATVIVPMLAHINANGGTSVYVTSNEPDINEGYLRYAVSVKFNSDTTKNWSVSNADSSAVWDDADNPSYMLWHDAKAACENSGGRLPTIEELKALWDAYGEKPDSFIGNVFWSSTIAGTGVWALFMNYRTLISIDFGDESQNNFRCVR